MEEIRKQRLVRGIACALWGALDRRGFGRSALRASADVAIDYQRSISFVA